MKKVSFSAPGSIMLSGEYGINFGKPLLISAIDLRITVTLVQIINKIPQEEYVDKAIEIVKNYLDKNKRLYKNILFSISVLSALPESEVFGYQSALYVALVAALLLLYSDTSFSQEVISSLAYQLEKKMKKKSYGIRTSVSTFGGLLYFRKEFEFLRTISLLNVKIPKIIEEKLFIVKIPGQAILFEEMENAIGKRYNRDTEGTDHLLHESEKITKRMVVSLIKEDADMFKKCIVKNNTYLTELRQTTKNVNQLHQEAKTVGVGTVLGDQYVLKFVEGCQEKSLLNRYRNTIIFKQSFHGINRVI